VAAEPERPLVLTVEQAVACIDSAYHDAPYVEALRLAAGAKMRSDQVAIEFWRQVAEQLGFDRRRED
jgi:hypothetical protein